MSMYFPTTTIKGTSLFSSQCMRENIFLPHINCPKYLCITYYNWKIKFKYHWQMSEAKERLFGS